MTDLTPGAALTRRSALALAALAPAAAAAAAGPAAPVAALFARSQAQADAFMSGDMDHWLGIVGLGPDFTLMQPFGGPTSHGFDASPEHLAAMAAYFRGGRATLVLAQSYAVADMVVLVFDESQRARVGGLPEQEWSLRVTQVFRRDGETWHLVHRHADPLIRHIGLDRAAALARGA
jgi:ketosteroid isomerase-like protein